MKYAVVEIAGNQYKVSEGEEIEVSKIDEEKGKKLTFEKVFLVVENKKKRIGDPLVRGATVTAEILEQIKGKKVRVATYKAKSRYRRVKGFRPHLTRVKILSIM